MKKNKKDQTECEKIGCPYYGITVASEICEGVTDSCPLQKKSNKNVV